jgi:DNA polymerase III epsilon subunit family exonuclease
MYIFLFIIILVAVIYALTRTKKSKKSEINFSVLPRRFVVFDLETTGLKPELNEIIEIGAIKIDLTNPASSTDQLQGQAFETLIKPAKKIPKKISEITGITQEMVDSRGEQLAEALPSFLEFIGDLPLVSFNSDFDMAFINQAISKCLPERRINNKVSCALKMARKAWPGLKSYKLSELSRLLKLSDDGTHRALADTKRALVIYVHAATALNHA